MERIGVEFPVGDAFDFTEFFAVDFSKAASDAFGRGGEERKVEFVLLGVRIASFAHVSNNIKAEITRIFIFAMVFAGHSDEGFGEADEAD